MSKAQETRLNILQKAFELVYTKGYQASSIDDIIANTRVTKGAFYHHFKTKDEMGVAIIQELLKPAMLHSYINPLRNSVNPVKDIHAVMKRLLLETPELQMQYGCPAGNLVQEMTPWNEAFGKVLEEMTIEWKSAIQQSLANGKKNGILKKDIHTEQIAYQILSGYWGIRSIGRVLNNAKSYDIYLKGLRSYLSSLQS